VQFSFFGSNATPLFQTINATAAILRDSVSRAISAPRWSIATYATNAGLNSLWQLVFANARLFFVGSDDIPAAAEIEASQAINQALEAGWQGLGIPERVPLERIAQAHEFLEHPTKAGHAVVLISPRFVLSQIVI
jgi:NADPH2:quinone reductase